MNKLFLLFFFSIIAQSQNYLPESLFTLIQLNSDKTEVNLKDYIPNLKDYQITYSEKGLDIASTGNIISITGEMIPLISSLQIKTDGKIYDIPIRKSNRMPYTFTFKPDRTYKDLKIKGNFNGWDMFANPLILKDGIYTFDTQLNPAKYEYVFVENGQEFPDPTNPERVSNGIGGINSVFTVGDLSIQKPFIYAQDYNKNKITVLNNNEQSDDFFNYVVFYNNKKIDFKSSKNGNTIIFEIPEEAKSKKRSFIRVYGYDKNYAANDLLIPLEYGIPVKDPEKLTRKDKNTMIIYSLMIDRFKDGNLQNNRPWKGNDVIVEANWQGGDLKGVIDKVNDGYFKSLGVNTLWLSPIIQNPEIPYAQMNEYGIKTKFTGYHGYWPVSSSKIDNRFGTEKELKNLISDAHQKDMNILLDYVANHIHEEHPIVKEKPDWFSSLNLPDGRKNIKLYDEYRLTTWFEDFMPDVSLEKPEVAEAMSDSAVYWFKHYDIDGFRHDATKHIPNSFWRTLTQKLRTQIINPQNRDIYQIGETYGGNDLIASYVNTGMLDGQFDFNIYHHLTHGIMDESYSLENIKNSLEESLYYYGGNHLMGNISGNHDKGRIISYADGSLSFNESAKAAGYLRDINNQNGKIGYEKVAQLMAFNLFVPGIPIIYYGDEIGMPGGDDPDNRRMMIFDNLNENQLWLKNTITKLAELRRNRLETMYGATHVEKATENYMIIKRVYFDKISYLILNKSDKELTITIEDIDNTFSPQFGNAVIMPNSTEIHIKPNSFEWFIN